MTKGNHFFEAICKVSRRFGTTLDKDEILSLVVQDAVRTMKGKAACLWLVDEENNEFVPVAQRGLSEKYFRTAIGLGEITSTVMEEGYLHAYDAATDSRLEHHEAKKAEGIASILIVPAKVKGELIGVLSLFTSEPRNFSKDEIDFLTALAEQGGMAIEHARLFEKIRKNTKLFHDLSASINSTLDIRKIMHILSAEVAEALGVRAASIHLLDEDRQNLEPAANYGLSEKYLHKSAISGGKSMAEALKGEWVRDTAKDKGVWYSEEKEEGIVSILNAPIKSKDEILGVLRLYSGVRREFTEDEIMLVSALALQGGLAIQNASIYLMLQEDMKDLKDDVWSHRSWF